MCVACLIGNGHFQNDFHLSISNAVLVIIFVLIISHIHFLITSCHCLGEFLLLIVSLVSGLLDYKGTLPLHLQTWCKEEKAAPGSSNTGGAEDRRAKGHSKPPNSVL